MPKMYLDDPAKKSVARSDDPVQVDIIVQSRQVFSN